LNHLSYTTVFFSFFFQRKKIGIGPSRKCGLVAEKGSVNNSKWGYCPELTCNGHFLYIVRFVIKTFGYLAMESNFVFTRST
jgi:hypothetical protein